MSFVRIIILVKRYLAGFCENSLGHVERLNVDKMEWEEISSVKLPRTKFCAV